MLHIYFASFEDQNWSVVNVLFIRLLFRIISHIFLGRFANSISVAQMLFDKIFLLLFLH